MKRFITIIIVISYFASITPLYAEVFYFSNGDKINGQVVSENDENYSVKTDAMGVVSVSKGYLAKVVSERGKVVYQKNQKIITGPQTPTMIAAKEKAKKLWNAELSAGFDYQTGNTEQGQANANFKISRKTKKNEFTVKGTSYYSETHKKMDAQRYGGSVRYAYSFGKTLKWYNYYKIEGDHDRFANINARATPSVGIGYWFYDTDDFQLLAETGLGVTYTNFRDDMDAKTELVMIPLLFFKKKLIGNLTVSEAVIVYPSLTSVGDFRLHSETILENPITEWLAIRFSLIDDYNNNPGPNTKDNDIRAISSLVYKY